MIIKIKALFFLSHSTCLDSGDLRSLSPPPVCPRRSRRSPTNISFFWCHKMSRWHNIRVEAESKTILLVYISRRISLVKWIWKYIVQGAAADNIVNISQGPRHCLYCPRQSRGQYRQCRGPSDIFFHDHCSQWDPPRYIVFIPQINPCLSIFLFKFNPIHVKHLFLPNTWIKS